MITVGLDGRAAQGRRSLDTDAVGALLNDRAHSAEALRHGGDPVAFLDAELARAVDACDAFGLGRQHEQGRDLVDGGRYVGGFEDGGTKALPGDGHHAARLDVARRPFDLDLAAHRSQHREEGDPGRVEADITDDDRPARPQCRRRHPEGG